MGFNSKFKGLIVTDVFGQPIGSMLKGRTVHEECQEHLGTQLCRKWCGQ
jgi:hypothetical protein